MLLNDAYGTKWLTCSRQGGAIVVRLTAKANANRNFSWDFNTLTFLPVEKEDCVALKSALQAERGINQHLRENVKEIEAEFERSKAANRSLERKMRDLEAENELLKDPPGGQDAEELQADFEICLARFRTLSAKAAKAKMRLCLVPTERREPSERRSKRLRSAK